MSHSLKTSKVKSGAELRPTILYTADGYTTRGKKLMGRQAAGEQFLRALTRRYQDKPLNVLALDGSDLDSINTAFANLGHRGQLSCYTGSQLDQSDTELLYLPVPGIGEYAWRRLSRGEQAYSICGVTHTTASHNVMESISSLLTTPVRDWDALICTSTAVRESVNRILEPQMEFLKWKLGATRFELPQLPIIPLGVHCDDFEFTEQNRAISRSELGVGETDIVLLFAGRLSFHAKAHPHPMFEAAQIVAEKLKTAGRKIHLVQSGWYSNSSIEVAFERYAELIAPDVNIINIDGRVLEARNTAWASADIFISLSDNIQETFGLTPIEAMAAGIPSVVSDWNGYKDTIEHGVTGFRVPTTMPPAGDGIELAKRYDLKIDSYDIYCGHTCELISVDIGMTALYLEKLAFDPELRAQMGVQAKQRVNLLYEWKVVMQRYQNLWEELCERRHFGCKALLPSLGFRQAPHRPDPFHLYEGYPTDCLSGTTRLEVRKKISSADFRELISSGVHNFARFVLPTELEYLRLTESIATKRSVLLADLIEAIEDISALRIRQIVAWLLKVGVLTVVYKENA
jgi:glycosyltransferase involved in cell wall biosynthesis